jgi:hypothetical protein
MIRFLLRCVLLPLGFVLALSIGAASTAFAGLAHGLAWVARGLGAMADRLMAALCAHVGIVVRPRSRRGTSVQTSHRTPVDHDWSSLSLPEDEPLFGAADIVRAANSHPPRFGTVSRSADAQPLLS